MSEKFYISKNNIESGPYYRSEIDRKLESGELMVTDLYYLNSEKTWKPIAMMPSDQAVSSVGFVEYFKSLDSRGVLLIVLCIIALLLSVKYFAEGGRIVILAGDSLSWPTASGVIQQSFVASHHGKISAYSPIIRYNLNIDSRYVSSSDKLIEHETLFSEDRARDIVSKYPPGSGVVVYYNQENPSESVLEPGFHLINFQPILFGICFLSLSIFCGLSAYAGPIYGSSTPRGYVFPEGSIWIKVRLIGVLVVLLEFILMLLLAL